MVRPSYDDLDELERAGEATALTMVPVGPVAHDFVHSRAYIRTIMGPFGSAKTTTCFQAILEIALRQPPDANGIRWSRGCITRPTYSQLQDTVMKDWFEWFPKTRENWNGDQMLHTLLLDIPGVAKLHIEVLFRACEDRKKAEQIFKGMQLTWLWPNEIDTQEPAILEFGLPRLGRYPPKSKGGCGWYGMIADLNAPDIDNWCVDLLVNKDMGLPPETEELLREQLGEDFRIDFFRQPGGMEPGAENLMNLPKGYYQRLMVGKSENWINRFVHNKFGAVRNGQPVYPEFNDEIHVARDALAPLAGVPVCMGVDAGSTPAAVFGQRDDMGRIRWLNELAVFAANDEVQLEKFDAFGFGETCGEFWLEHFARCDFGGAWGDPAAWDGPEDEFGWVKLFWKGFREKVGPRAARWKLRPAPCKGNRLPERHEAVRGPLKRFEGGQPAFQLSPSCRLLRRGFNNGYVLVWQQFSNKTTRLAPKPLKNQYSHVHDAGQYLNLGLTRRGALAEDGQVRSRDARRRSGGAKVDFGNSSFALRETA